MKKEEEHISIDQLLRDHFEEHTILPDEELWNNIEGRMSQKAFRSGRLKRLKIALIGSAAIVAGLVFMFHLFNNETPSISQVAEIESAENNIPHTDNSTKIDLSKIVEKKAEQQNTAEQPAREERRKLQKSPQQKNTTNYPQTEAVKERIQITPQKMELLTADNLLTNDDAIKSLENIKQKATQQSVITSEKSNKTSKSHAIHHSKHKNISAKKYYAQNSRQSSWKKQGNLLNDFDLKLNLSAMYSTRKNNNIQTDPLSDYDPAYFNEIEKGGISFNGGLDLGYNFNSNWSIYSGVEYTTYSIQVQHAQSRYKLVSSNQILIPSSAGNINISGNGLAELSAQSQFETKLRLHYLSIPFVARYRLNKDFYTNAGIKCEILMADKSLVSLNDDAVDFSVAKIDGLKKYNWGLVVGAGYESTRPSGFRFEIGPEITYNLTNLNSSAEVISKPLVIGIHSGIYLAKYKRL